MANDNQYVVFGSSVTDLILSNATLMGESDVKKSSARLDGMGTAHKMLFVF